MEAIQRELARWKALAMAASLKAYCPYSQFKVGAVIVTESGDEFIGCNVENASFGLSICAERNAVFQMVCQGQQQIKLAVIYTPTPHPVTPCGACRQVLNEFGPEARIISVCDSELELETSLDKLLPDAFGPHELG